MGDKNRFRIYALSQDPIYIGTGGYTIGRVDNTIVRDPITRIPKIPGSSLAGSWRYYMALTLQGFLKEKFACIKEALDNSSVSNETDVRGLVNRLADNDLKGEDKGSFSKRREKFIDYADRLKKEMVEESNGKKEGNEYDWKLYWGNLISSIKCAGQDERPNESLCMIDDRELQDTGHCGHCLVCKAFGFSKMESRQGRVFFSDLNVLFFPVNTRFGVRWITSPDILKLAGLEGGNYEKVPENRIIVSEKAVEKEFLNLGWINLKIEDWKDFSELNSMNDEIKELIQNKVVLVPDNLISQIINANLEVRTSVSIDPLTGAAREGALFTSEAIPRGTVFSSEIRIIDRLIDEELPGYSIKKALKDSKIYYENFGIGGMVTRGFGRLKIYFRQN